MVDGEMVIHVVFNLRLGRSASSVNHDMVYRINWGPRRPESTGIH